MAGKERSPNYPALSLSQALEQARKLWKAEGRAPASHEAAATAMGFKSLSGPARVAIGAMRQYGLVDKTDKGHIKMSPLGVRALAGEPDDQKAALQQAATSPPLFKELAQTHPDASENNIRAYLITKKGFIDDGARKAAKAFRATLALAKAGASGYTPDDNAGDTEDMSGTDIGQNAGTGGGSGGGKPPDGFFSLNVPFAKGNISVQVRVTGDAMSPAHLARVRKYLELAEQDWNEGEG
jgi:hypothetical protein